MSRNLFYVLDVSLTLSLPKIFHLFCIHPIQSNPKQNKNETLMIGKSLFENEVNSKHYIHHFWLVMKSNKFILIVRHSCFYVLCTFFKELCRILNRSNPPIFSNLLLPIFFPRIGFGPDNAIFSIC